MKFYLGVTDNNWYNYLSKINPEDINFWQPGGTVTFKVLTPCAPFLFKLKSPLNVIGGIGFFSSHTFLPITITWDTFRNRARNRVRMRVYCEIVFWLIYFEDILEISCVRIVFETFQF